MSYRSFTIFSFLLIGLLLVFWQGGWFQRWAAELGVIRGERSVVEVVRVVDGDTVEVLKSGKQTTVRMIGIDTPETVRPGVPVECGGPEASAWSKKMIAEGQKVRMVSDPTQDKVDKYGRSLAYLYPMRSPISFGEKLLAAGWAEELWYTRGQETSRYNEAAAQAKKKNLGVWRLCGGDFHSAE